MIFWLTLIIFVIGILLLVRKSDSIVGLLCIIMAGTLLIMMVLFLVVKHTGVNAMVEQKKEVYNAIEYKVTSNSCRDEFGLLSKEVIDEVQEWNSGIKYGQSIQDDFWWGIFYPNVYDQFEVIDYESYNTGNPSVSYEDVGVN